MHDVAVVGAGPGGSAAAYYLAKAGLDVLLLDKEDFPRDKTCGDALTPRAIRVLTEMEVLEEAETIGFRVNGLKMFAKRGATMSSPISSETGLPAYLLVVPRMYLDDILRRRAMTGGASFESPIRVNAISSESNGVHIFADRNGQPIELGARVVILAIGANMKLLQDAGLLKRQPKPIVAIRGYYEGLQGLDDSIQIHFEDVPMPGYGWIFPVTKDSANIGVGVYRQPGKTPSPLRAAMDRFVNGPRLRPMLSGAKSVGRLKSYPLRIDFTTAPTYGERTLLIGETAGLVSPLTGEGIDFALESGRLAASFLEGVFASGDFSKENFTNFDRRLREEFQSLFRWLGYLRHAYVNPFVMDRMIKLCEKDAEVRDLTVGVLMSQQHPANLLRLKLLGQLLLSG